VDRLARIVVISSVFSVNNTEHSGAIVNFEVKRGDIPKSQQLFFTLKDTVGTLRINFHREF
jgi:hypothetical protein